MQAHSYCTKSQTSSRRQFCSLTSAALVASLAASQKMTFGQSNDGDGWIDAHVHVWTPNVQKYPLDAAFSVADMQPASFTPDQLLAYTRPSGVDRIVLIQMSFYGLNQDYMFDCLHTYPGVFSAVALIDHKSPSVEQQRDN